MSVFRKIVLSVFIRHLGRDPSIHRAVGSYLGALLELDFSDDFLVICGDLMAKLVPDFTNKMDSCGIWIDDDHGLNGSYDEYAPCGITRKPGDKTTSPSAFTAEKRLVYIYLSVLDEIKGRLPAHYKDRIFHGESIDEYDFLPSMIVS